MKPQETHREATRIRHLSRAPSARSGDMASQKRSVRWPGFVHHFAYSFLIRKLRWVPLAAPLPHLAIMSASMIPMTLTGTNSDQRSAAGYRGIFAAVASSASHKLYRVALRRTRNAAEAEDVSQEALLKALTHLHQFQGPEGSANSFQSWLHRIAENQSIDMLRRRRADKLLSLDAPAGEQRDTLAARLVSRADSPERLYERRHTRRRLADAIEQLRPDLRSVILLRDVLQYSTAETAGRLAISATAVRVRLFRARRQLRERLHEEARTSVRRQVPASRRPERRAPVFAPVCALSSFACGD